MLRVLANQGRFCNFFSFLGALALTGSSLVLTSGGASAQNLTPISVASNEYSVILPAKNLNNSPHHVTSRLMSAKNTPGVLPLRDSSISPVSTPAEETAASTAKLVTHAELRGWDHLFNLLVDEGVDAKTLVKVLSDPRMPEYEPLIFSLQPRESHALYRKHNNRAAQRNALAFYRKHEQDFGSAEEKYFVPKGLILALLQVETGCGANTGRDRIFFRLARLAAAGSSENIQENYLRKKRTVKLLSIDEVGKRAATLEDLFLKHTAATFALAERLSTDPLEIRGSSAGAIGMPQFLPGNVTTYGVDGDGNGAVNIFEASDAIHSVGNYLHSFGWTNARKMSEQEKRDVIRFYNRSEPYISTVLSLQAALEPALLRGGEMPEQASTPQKKVSKVNARASSKTGKAQTKLEQCADKDGIRPCK